MKTATTMGWNHDWQQQAMLIGYARASTQDPNLDLQREAPLPCHR